MYRPSSQFRRTPEERRDQLLSWNREDQAFFAAGACHILAFAFLETYPQAGFRPIGLWPRGLDYPGHVYVGDGTWAFDHDGWTMEGELISVSCAAEPEADFRALPIEVGLDTFCARHNHRPRHLFAFDPWSRAQRYIEEFPHPDKREQELKR